MALGFDAVLGNPPYVFARAEGIESAAKNFFEANYEHQNYQLNLYSLFTERSHGHLHPGGRIGFILPNNWLTLVTMAPFRRFIIDSTGPDTRIENHLYHVFKNASVDTMTLVTGGGEPDSVLLSESPRKDERTTVAEIQADDIDSEDSIQFRIYKTPGGHELLASILTASVQLNSVAIVKSGLVAYSEGRGDPPQNREMMEQRIYHADNQVDEDWRPYLEGRDVIRYRLDWTGGWILYGDNIAEPRVPELYQGERLVIRQIPSKPPLCIQGAFVDDEHINDRNSMIVKSDGDYDIRYLLGILNSKLVSIWFDIVFDKFQRSVFPQFKVGELARFPIPSLDLQDAEQKALHDEIVELVRQRLTEDSDEDWTDLDEAIEERVMRAFGIEQVPTNDD